MSHRSDDAGIVIEALERAVERLSSILRALDVLGSKLDRLIAATTAEEMSDPKLRDLIPRLLLKCPHCGTTSTKHEAGW